MLNFRSDGLRMFKKPLTGFLISFTTEVVLLLDVLWVCSSPTKAHILYFVAHISLFYRAYFGNILRISSSSLSKWPKWQNIFFEKTNLSVLLSPSFWVIICSSRSMYMVRLTKWAKRRLRRTSPFRHSLSISLVTGLKMITIFYRNISLIYNKNTIFYPVLHLPYHGRRPPPARPGGRFGSAASRPIFPRGSPGGGGGSNCHLGISRVLFAGKLFTGEPFTAEPFTGELFTGELFTVPQVKPMSSI